MKNTLSFVIYLSLFFSLLTGMSAHGQSAQQPALSIDEAITAEMNLASTAQPSEGISVTVGQWSASVTGLRSQRLVNTSFRIRIGRGFSITVPRN